MAQVINNKEEFEEFYPYDKKYIKEYPKEYPCICYWETELRGIMGDERVAYIAYFPKDVTIQEAFLAGVHVKWERIR